MKHSILTSNLFISFNIIMWLLSPSIAIAQEVGDSVHAANEPLPEVVDSAFLAQLDSLIEIREQEKMVEDALAESSKKRLKRELGFNPDGWTHLMRGAIVSYTDRKFISHQSVFEKKSDAFNTIDYGVAGAPLAATWMLKMAGVKSRSNWNRFVTANAMSLGIAVGASKGLKHFVDETRPDGSDDKAFPSGHTTIAFVSATILAREYGYISPWITVGGYTCASATQMLRIGHNKHWMNDLYVGAGIGMVSTNLGYYLTDLIFKEKGLQVSPEVRLRDIQRVIRFNTQPSGFAFVSGTEAGSRSFDVSDVPVKSSAALTVGADFSWFFNPYIAAEFIGRATMGQAKVYNNRVSEYRNHSFTGDILQLYHADVAAKFSIPHTLSQRFAVRVLAGVRHMEELNFHGVENPSSINPYVALQNPMKNPVSLHLPSETAFEFGSGFCIEAIDKENYSVGVNVDYLHAFSSVMKNRYNIGTVWKILF